MQSKTCKVLKENTFYLHYSSFLTRSKYKSGWFTSFESVITLTYFDLSGAKQTDFSRAILVNTVPPCCSFLINGM